jgi:hypothetical protein
MPPDRARIDAERELDLDFGRAMSGLIRCVGASARNLGITDYDQGHIRFLRRPDGF